MWLERLTKNLLDTAFRDPSEKKIEAEQKRDADEDPFVMPMADIKAMLVEDKEKRAKVLDLLIRGDIIPEEYAEKGRNTQVRVERISEEKRKEGTITAKNDIISEGEGLTKVRSDRNQERERYIKVRGDTNPKAKARVMKQPIFKEVTENVGLIRQILRQNYLPELYSDPTRRTERTATTKRPAIKSKKGRLGYLDMIARALSPKLGIPLGHFKKAAEDTTISKAMESTSSKVTAEKRVTPIVQLIQEAMKDRKEPMMYRVIENPVRNSLMFRQEGKKQENPWDSYYQPRFIREQYQG